MASTNWDTDRKRRGPPAWDPPKLPMVIVMHIVVGTSGVVGVVVDGGVWLLDSDVWWQQLGIERGKGEKGKQSNREYSSQVLASKELHYICICINERGSICGLNCRMPE